MYFLYFTICTIGGSQEERLLVEVWALLPWSKWFSTIPECHDGVVYDTSLRDLGIQFSQYLEEIHMRSSYCRYKCFFHVGNTILLAKMLFVYESNTMPSIFFLPPWQKQIRSNYRAVKSQVYFELSRNRDSTMKGFEPSSHFKSMLSLIVRVNVVLNRTAAVDSEWRLDILCGSHLQSQSELYHVSWWY